MGAIIRGCLCYSSGIVAAIFLEMFNRLPNKFNVEGLLYAILAMSVAIGLGIFMTKKKPVFIIIYAMGIAFGMKLLAYTPPELPFK